MPTQASFTEPAILNENKMTINSFLRQSYDSAKKNIEDGASFIKEELTTLYDKTSECLNRMALPVNNFLKDHLEIDFEMQQYEMNGLETPASANVIPIEIALLSPMEENY
jgi:hypothetical protein